MTVNYGKMFEEKLRQDWQVAFPDGLIFRLPDQVSGRKLTSANVSDFIAFNDCKLFFLEAKSVHKTSFAFTNLRQYELMLKYVYVKNVMPIVIIWFVDLDKVIAVPTLTIKKMKQDGMKSLNPKTVDRNKYYIIDIPSVKLRTFMRSDYSVLNNVLFNRDIENYGGNIENERKKNPAC